MILCKYLPNTFSTNIVSINGQPFSYSDSKFNNCEVSCAFIQRLFWWGLLYCNLLKSYSPGHIHICFLSPLCIFWLLIIPFPSHIFHLFLHRAPFSVCIENRCFSGRNGKYIFFTVVTPSCFYSPGEQGATGMTKKSTYKFCSVTTKLSYVY